MLSYFRTLNPNLKPVADLLLEPHFRKFTSNPPRLTKSQKTEGNFKKTVEKNDCI